MEFQYRVGNGVEFSNSALMTSDTTNYARPKRKQADLTSFYQPTRRLEVTTHNKPPRQNNVAAPHTLPKSSAVLLTGKLTD